MITYNKTLGLLCNRVLAIREVVKDKWPIYADPETGRWHTSDNGEWCDGHWIDMLRMTGELLGRNDLIEEAFERTEKIRYKILEGKISGHRFYYSAARLWATKKNHFMKTIALSASYTTRMVALRSNGAIPIGSEMEKAFDLSGGSLVAIDAVHPYMVLDWWAFQETGDSTFLIGAERMLKVFEKHFIREDGSTIQFVEFNPSNGLPIKKFVHQGYSHDSCWSRGQAWAIAGVLMALEQTNDCYYFDLSKKVFGYWWEQCQEKIPPYDFMAPKESNPPIDTSASAIVVSSLARLMAKSQHPEVISFYGDKFISMLDHLLQFIEIETDSSTFTGMLKSGCYDFNRKLATNHELIWGNYYLMEALYCLEKGGVPC